MVRNLYGLLVGINHYADPNLDLEGCINDITEIEEYLNNRLDRNQYQLHLRTLKDQQATRDAVVEEFRNHLCQANSNDVVLFYYSGHGYQEDAPEEFWQYDPDRRIEALLCYDSCLEGKWGLADKELAKLIAEVAADKNLHICIILDCCHSGSGTRDPMQTTKVRRAILNKGVRPLNTFLFEISELKHLSASQNPEEHPTGWKMPKGRHVLLAACRDIELAQENNKDNKNQGVFSYFLRDTLYKANGKLTYQDLYRRTNAIIRNEVDKQSPQLEVAQPGDENQFFLDGAIGQRFPYFIVKYDNKYASWMIDGGTIHGVQGPKNGETTLLAVFLDDIDNEDLYIRSKSVGEAEVTEVLPSQSKISIKGVENLTKDRIFKAVIISLPLPALGVYFEGEEQGVNLALEALKIAGPSGQQPSLYVRQEQESHEAQFRLLCRDGQYLITRSTDPQPLVAEIEGYTPENAKKAILRLEHISRWTTTKLLSSPATSRIQPNDVQIEILFEDPDLSESRQTTQMRLEYKHENNEWKPRRFKLKLINNSNKPLYCALLDISENYGVSLPFFDTGTVLLQPKGKAGNEVWAWDDEEAFLEFQVPDEFWERGITEYLDIIKLIVSTTDFDPSLLKQNPLDLPRKDIGLRDPLQSTLDRLMNRLQSRDIVRSTVGRIDDWITKELAITTVRPKDATPVSPEEQREKDLGAGVKLQPHSSLVAYACLTTVPQASRDLGNMIVPEILRQDPEVTRPLQFTSSRGTDPGLSVLELSQVQDHTVVTPDEPLKLIVDVPLAENEHILPVSFDGELFLPLGFEKQSQEGKIEIILERLPYPIKEGKRSLQGSIRIFFQKVISKTSGQKFDYPILALAEVGDDKKVTYIKDATVVKQRVAQAKETKKKIALYIHGIIGDTESLVATIKQLITGEDGQQHSVSSLYDLVLCFDYENLNTSIEQNAQHLKRRLTEVGLGSNHGTQLHIIAHSMGGLISRWFIEREEGHKVVQSLIMLGTPNAGSPWPVVEQWVTFALGIALNNLSVVPWPTTVLASLMNLNPVAVALKQMNPTSDFLGSLVASDDPGIPYSIIAGNTSIIIPESQEPEAEKPKLLKRLMQKLFNQVAALPFLGEPNDIAVTVDSITSLPSGRSLPPHIQEVACDHMSYFSTDVGLKALLAVLTHQK